MEGTTTVACCFWDGEFCEKVLLLSDVLMLWFLLGFGVVDTIVVSLIGSNLISFFGFSSLSNLLDLDSKSLFTFSDES